MTSTTAARGVSPDLGVLALPIKRLWPFFSLWTMHVWIYWFNTTPLRDIPAERPWWVGIYGIMTAVLLVAAFAHRRQGGAERAGRFDVPMTAAMCACSLSVLAAGTAQTDSVAWSALNVVAAGTCMGWGYLRWSVLFADLGIRDAVACLFASYAVGSSLKVVFDLAPGVVGCAMALAIPVVSTASLRLAARTLAEEESAAQGHLRREGGRGETLYRRGSYSTLVRVALCVFAFCLVRQIASNSLDRPLPTVAGTLLSHAVEVAFAAVALAWVFRLNRALDFPQLWRFVFLFVATTIAVDCLGLPPVVSSLCSSVSASLVVMLLWLLLSDVAHHSDLHPYVVFGIGWSLYTGANYLGLALVRTTEIASSTMALGVALLWFLGVVMVFCLETRDPDVQRIFADLRRKVDPEEFASIDERCEQIAREYDLTEREVDVLKLLAKGRSKAYIAEALVISENTVRGHARRLYAKLGVHTRDELQGLIGL